MDCLDCLAEVQRKRRFVREAQADLLENGKDNDSLMQAQFREGQLNVLDWVQTLMEKTLNARQS